MSSFEPLFDRARDQRSAGTSAVSADVWMPMRVDQESSEMPSIFVTDREDEREATSAAVRAAHDAAIVAARQAELDDAYTRGLTEGRDEGELAERARLRTAVMCAEQALDDLRANETRWLTNIEENIAAIAVAAAQQVIVREVTTAADIVLEIVTRAVQEFGLDHALTIRINPADLEALQSTERLAADDVTGISRSREVRWMSDARIERGGCLVEGRERIVDGRVDTGLDRLYRRLTHTNA